MNDVIGAPRPGRTILVLGRQGSGKGVQSERLAADLGLEHVSTGAALREAVRRGTALGALVEPSLVRGELVSDEVVARVVAERLDAGHARCDGVVLDGYPRTVAQAERLVELLAPRRIDAAVELVVPRSLAVERLLGRRVCPSCGNSGRAARCERCGAATEARADDTPEAIGRRMSDDARESVPLRAWLERRDLLVSVDGVGPVDEVAARVRGAVDARLASSVS